MSALEQIAQTGFLGALIVACIGAVNYLYESNEAQSMRAIKERGEFVLKIIENASNSEKLAASISGTNKAMQSLADAQRALTAEIRRTGRGDRT